MAVPASTLLASRVDEERLVFTFIEWLLPQARGDRLHRTGFVGDSKRRARWEEFWKGFKADGTMEWATFERFVRYEERMSVAARRIFNVLDDAGTGYITTREMLDARRAYERSLDCKHLSGLDELKRVLMYKYHGNMVRAWRKLLDPDGTGRCCHAVFVKACKEIGFSDLKSAWVELTHGCPTRSIGLVDLDPAVDRLLWLFIKNLRTWYDDPRESWFTIIRTRGIAGRLMWPDFLDVCRQMQLSQKDARSLFNALDLDEDQGLTREEWRFLSLWDSQRDVGGSDSETCASLTLSSTSFQPPQRGTSRGAPSRQGSPRDGRKLLTFTVILSKEEYEDYCRRREEVLNSGSGAHARTGSRDVVSNRALPVAPTLLCGSIQTGIQRPL